MSARDSYNIGLKCPNCHRMGQAHVTEDDGASWIKRRDRCVVSVPEGFIVVNHGRNHRENTIIHCECGGVVPTEGL